MSEVTIQQAPTIILRLAIPSPLRTLFDYLPLPDTQLNQLIPGMRFRVSFGTKRHCIAYFINTQTHSHINPKQLKTVIEQIDLDESCLPGELFELLHWSVDYYHFSLGLGLQSALPKKIRRGAPLQQQHKAWQLSTKGLGLCPTSLKRAKQQKALVECLLSQGTISHQDILAQGFSTATLRALQTKELITTTVLTTSAITPQQAEHSLLQEPPLTLTSEQQTSFTDITTQLNAFSCHLIHGITGSGKTEIYLQAIAAVLQQNKQALVLVPEIALTPQTVSRFEKRFNCPVITLHSKVSDTQRYQHWLNAKSGQARIIIGTRSAVFTPFHHLGMIIIDEEHDTSYKQQTGFRYSGKDVAIRRAQQLNIPIVLGSATPSCESLENARQGRFRLHTLSKRANRAQSPSVHLIDIRQQALQEGISLTLLQAIQERIQNQQQVIIFINRRGFAPVLLCRSCGWTAQCINCDSRLIMHKQQASRQANLQCHHCNHRQAAPTNCPHCQQTSLEALGQGTQRSEAFLQSQFKDTPIIRVDRDTTNNSTALIKQLESLPENAPAILIGTQILAKGHHFPNVTLVCILDSDTWLFSNDFRSEERMAQLITQVSGRAGRGDKPGQTLIQTHVPDHPFWINFFQGGYSHITNDILAQRRATKMPPYAYLCLIHAEHRQAATALMFLSQARTWLDKHAIDIHSIGPYPSSLARKAKHYRFQLQFKSQRRKHLHQTVDQLQTYLESLSQAKRVNWTIDIDPQEFF